MYTKNNDCLQKVTMTKEAFDFASLTHPVMQGFQTLAEHYNSIPQPITHGLQALGMHLAGNAGLKMFLKGGGGGLGLGPWAAKHFSSKGFRHGATGKSFHPYAVDAMKQVFSPEMLSAYDNGKLVGKAFKQAPNVGEAGLQHLNGKPMHHVLSQTVSGAQDGLSKLRDPNYKSSLLGKLGDKVLTIDESAVKELHSQPYAGVKRLAANIGTGTAAVMTGLPGMLEHVTLNTVRTVSSRTRAGKAAVKKRLLKGALGIPENKWKRRFIDYIVSPGYGDIRDVGANLKELGVNTGLKIKDNTEGYLGRLKAGIRAKAQETSEAFRAHGATKEAAINPAMIADDVLDLYIVGRRAVDQSKRQQEASQIKAEGKAKQQYKQAGILGEVGSSVANATIKSPLFLGLAGAGVLSSMYGPHGLGGPENPEERGTFNGKRALKSVGTWMGAGYPLAFVPANINTIRAGNVGLNTAGMQAAGAGLGLVSAGAVLHSIGKGIKETGVPSFEHNKKLRNIANTGSFAMTVGPELSFIREAYVDNEALNRALARYAENLDDILANRG